MVLENLEIEKKEKFPLKSMTTFKVGGVAERVWFPKTQSEFVTLLKELKNYIVLGSCSDIIVSSAGLKQDLICTSKLQGVQYRGTRVVADCGVKGPKLAQETVEKGLSGFEFMIGFPGSIGGNVFMNAGAHAQTISDTFVEACVFDVKKKEILMLTKNEMQFGYRHSVMHEKPYVLISAEFDLKKANAEELKVLVQRNLEFRKTHQPSLVIPNAGSVFKNPENDSAGRLLDKAGVKEFSYGDAKVWDGHANFIVNMGSATSSDILELMTKMKLAVKEKYTIDLVPEIRFVGEKTVREKELCKILYNVK